MNNTKSNLSEAEIIKKNYDTFLSQTRRMLEQKKITTSTLVKTLEESFEDVALAPASTRKSYVSAYPGGLIEHSLRVLMNLGNLANLYEIDSTTDSVLLVGLFSDIGKIGTEKKAYYQDQTSSWHREKLGQNYTVSEAIGHMPITQLSLQFLVRNGVIPSYDEWFAISNLKQVYGQAPSVSTEASEGSLAKSKLAMALQHAVEISTLQGKNSESVKLIM